ERCNDASGDVCHPCLHVVWQGRGVEVLQEARGVFISQRINHTDNFDFVAPAIPFDRVLLATGSFFHHVCAAGHLCDLGGQFELFEHFIECGADAFGSSTFFGQGVFEFLVVCNTVCSLRREGFNGLDPCWI